MTIPQQLEIPFHKIDEWEEVFKQSPCLAFFNAAQWGADQELEACCSIALTDPVCGTKHQRRMLVQHIKEQRRPKELSQKERALIALDILDIPDKELESEIREALETLPNNR